MISEISVFFWNLIPEKHNTVNVILKSVDYIDAATYQNVCGHNTHGR